MNDELTPRKTDEFEIWFEKLGNTRVNGQYPCTICEYNGDGYCPAANWMEPELNLLKCRETLWNTIRNLSK